MSPCPAPDPLVTLSCDNGNGHHSGRLWPHLSQSCISALAPGQVHAVIECTRVRVRGENSTNQLLDLCFEIPSATSHTPHVHRLMQASGVRKARMQREGGAQAELLEEYAYACTRVDFQPPLSIVESTFLQDLQSDR